MELLVGLILALGVSFGGTAVGLDKDRAFYAAVALTVGTYYLLFAVMGGSPQALAQEIGAYTILAAVTIFGFRGNYWLVVAALAGHGVFDIFHSQLILNDGVPDYWPLFCLSYDVTAAAYLAWLLIRRSRMAGARAQSHPVRLHVQAELDAANAEMTPAASFHRLERAHVLSQTSTRDHVRVHWHMLLWGLRQHDGREIAGQLLRIVGAATKTAFGLVPIGNTGGANVSPVKPMPVPRDLAAILASAEPVRGQRSAQTCVPTEE